VSLEISQITSPSLTPCTVRLVYLKETPRTTLGGLRSEDRHHLHTWQVEPKERDYKPGDVVTTSTLYVM
jgi:hypothetical protein